MKKLVEEHFKSLYELINTLSTRPKNEIMKDEDSSDEGSYDFTLTESYDKAEHLLKTGYVEILPKVLEGIRQSEKQVKAIIGESNKNIPRNHVVGFVPNVPNALQGLPESMITIDRNIQKKKCMNIYYVMEGNCGTNPELWVNAGIALLSAIKLIELTGISVKLEVCFIAARAISSTEQQTFSSVIVKNYQDRLDIQKLCFPIAHPSMFRRFGFRWLETHPDIEDKGFQGGYGRAIENLSKIKENFAFPDNSFVINGQWICDHDNKVTEVLKYLNNKLDE